MLMVGGLLALIPMTLLFGGFGFVAGMVFIVLIAVAK